MSVWVTFHEPGEVVPLHTHECEEIITIIAGEAIVTVAGQSIPGARRYEYCHPPAYTAWIQELQ
jgi:hypothetical protein